MSDALGIPVVPISAAKGEGVSELVDQALQVAKSKTLPKVWDFCSDGSPVHRCIHAIVHLIEDHSSRLDLPSSLQSEDASKFSCFCLYQWRLFLSWHSGRT